MQLRKCGKLIAQPPPVPVYGDVLVAVAVAMARATHPLPSPSLEQGYGSIRFINHCPGVQDTWDTRHTGRCLTMHSGQPEGHSSITACLDVWQRVAPNNPQPPILGNLEARPRPAPHTREP